MVRIDFNWIMILKVFVLLLVKFNSLLIIIICLVDEIGRNLVSFLIMFKIKVINSEYIFVIYDI